MATTAVETEWARNVVAATTQDQFDALAIEAIRGGFWDKSRYILIQQNQATLRQVNKVLTDTALKAFAPLENLTQQGAGGLFRSTIPGLVDQFGNVNAQVAVDYYRAQRFAWSTATQPQRLANAVSAQDLKRLTRNASRQAVNRAQAQLKAQVAIAKGYEPKLPKFNAVQKSDSIINYAMQLFQSEGSQAADEITNAMTRAVASYNRDTILYNSKLDPDVVGVQRVAEPGACEFCQMVANDSSGSPRVSSYAADYHNHCRCSIETLYQGDSPYRPDYYDEFNF